MITEAAAEYKRHINPAGVRVQIPELNEAKKIASDINGFQLLSPQMRDTVVATAVNVARTPDARDLGQFANKNGYSTSIRQTHHQRGALLIAFPHDSGRRRTENEKRFKGRLAGEIVRKVVEVGLAAQGYEEEEAVDAAILSGDLTEKVALALLERK